MGELDALAEQLNLEREELREAHVQVEITRDRYASLSEFAPVGYMILNQWGAIQEINATGARILNRPGENLVRLPLHLFIAAGQHRKSLNYLRLCARQDGPLSIELPLRNQPVWIELTSVCD